MQLSGKQIKDLNKKKKREREREKYKSMGGKLLFVFYERVMIKKARSLFYFGRFHISLWN
jgi:hypothetical protein